jgi:hypothetical protein
VLLVNVHFGQKYKAQAEKNGKFRTFYKNRYNFDQGLLTF